MSLDFDEIKPGKLELPEKSELQNRLAMRNER
jgi:hypothetical protein